MKTCPHCGKEIAEGITICNHCQKPIAAVPAKRWYTMKATADKKAEVFIYADIGMWGITANQFQQDLAALGDITDLTIRINSYGGEVFDGNAIYNNLIAHPASKTVIVDGVAASMASVIAMAADPGKLKMPENAWLMIHDPSVSAYGTAEELRKNADLLDKLKDGVIKAYQRHATALTRDELWDLMEKESWISAADAVTYGLADKVIEEIDVKEPATNTGRISPLNNKGKIVLQAKPTGQLKQPATKGVVMDEKQTPEAAAQLAAHTREVNEARAEAAKTERERISGITARCEKHKLGKEFSDKLINGNIALDQAIPAILDEIERVAALAPVPPSPIVIKDSADKFREHAGNCIGVALNTIKDKEVIADVRKNPGPRDLHGLVRACLAQEGKLTAGEINRLAANDIASHAIRMAGMGSSDLPSILADTMNKEFMGGFEDAPTTFQAVCAETENPNFMSKSMTKLSGFSDIEEIPEGMAFKEGKFSDKKETIQLATAGKMLTLTRNLIINNDTSAISSFPRGMSAAMKQKMNRDFYDLLTYNTLVGPVTTEDSVAFFNETSHNNYKATSGVPSVASLGVADQHMLEQTLPKGDASATTTYLNLTGKILLTGTANRLTVLQLLGSLNDPAATDGKLVYNPYASGITPVFDAYLQAKLTAAALTYAWYWFAGPSVYRNWIVAYLAGNRTPTLRSEPSRVGEALGISYDIFFDYKFGFEDYRGVILNSGS
jgi:ATP-dependent protease ClpP protease subunit